MVTKVSYRIVFHPPTNSLAGYMSSMDFREYRDQITDFPWMLSEYKKERRDFLKLFDPGTMKILEDNKVTFNVTKLVPRSFLPFSKSYEIKEIYAVDVTLTFRSEKKAFWFKTLKNGW